MESQKDTCIFAGKHQEKNGAGCRALIQYICEKRNCPFYKSVEGYYIDFFWNVRKR